MVTPQWGTRQTSDGRRLRWWVEVLTILTFYLIYSAVRNANKGTTSVAFDHALQIVDWQQALRINHEEALQNWAMHSRLFIIAMNYVYGSLHFIVTAGAIIYLFRSHPDAYPRWRNTLACTTGLALIGFMLWPLMPPRLLSTVSMNYDFVDTLAKYPTFWSFDSGALQKISNQYAAMPSLHFAWSLFCAFSLAPRMRNRWWRYALAGYPALTLLAIVVTANHYILDAAGGAAIFGLGYLIGMTITRRRAAAPLPT